MNYKTLSNCWNGLSIYNLNGDNQMFRGYNTIEKYNPVTVPLSQYINYPNKYVNANMAADAGLSLSGTLPGGVVKGHVSQGKMSAMFPYDRRTSLQNQNNSGLGWVN
jgi:hypothetical protein